MQTCQVTAVHLRVHVPILGGCTPHRSMIPTRYIQSSVLKQKHTARHTEKVSANVTTRRKAGWGLIFLFMFKKLKLVSRSPLLGLRLQRHPEAVGDPLAAPPGWHQPLGLPKPDSQGYDRGDPSIQGGSTQSRSHCRQQGRQ